MKRKTILIAAALLDVGLANPAWADIGTDISIAMADPYHYDVWFSDFNQGHPSGNVFSVIPDYGISVDGGWIFRTTGGAILDNLWNYTANSLIHGSFLILQTQQGTGNYLATSITDPDLVEPMLGLHSLQGGKKYIVAFHAGFPIASGISEIGARGAEDGDVSFSGSTTHGSAAFFLHVENGVGTVVFRNNDAYGYLTPAGVTLPTTISINTTKTYQVELEYDGATTVSGRYRERSSDSSVSGWTSLGSASTGSMSLLAGRMLMGPYIATKATTNTFAEIDVDYLLLARDR